MTDLTALARQYAGDDMRPLKIERTNGAAATMPRYRFLTDTELVALPPPTWRLEGFLPDNSLAVLYGPPGSGKSFLALDWAMRVATRADWLGHASAGGYVIYVAAEGGGGFGQRVRVYRDANEVTEEAKIRFVREPVNLLSALDVGALLAGWRDLETGHKPALVVFDTLARCIPGGDENSAKDVGQAIANADMIRREMDAAVLLVHHTGKDGQLERGSSALRGAADAMFSLKEEDGILVLTTDKQKDAPEAEPVRLRLVPVGESCIIEPNETSVSLAGLTPNEREALQRLSEVAMADGASDKEWRENSQLANGSYYRARKRLVDLGYVAPNGRPKRYSLTGLGISRSTPNSQPTPNHSHGSSPRTPPHSGGLVEAPDGSTDLLLDNQQ